MSSSCIFCIIVRKNDPNTEIVLENDDLVIFKDIKPASKNHFLAVTKVHCDSAKTFKNKDIKLVENMQNSLRKVLQDAGADLNDSLFGFHWPPFTSVRHVHMHGIAPKSQMSFISRITFKPDSYWFYTVEFLLRKLNSEAN